MGSFRLQQNRSPPLIANMERRSDYINLIFNLPDVAVEEFFQKLNAQLGEESSEHDAHEDIR